MYVLHQQSHAVSASRVNSGRRLRRVDHVPPGKRDRIRSWARSQAGRASRSLAAPASVRLTSFSRRSSPGRMATQPESIRGRRFLVSVVSSRDISPPRSRWRTSPAALKRRKREYWVVRRPTPRRSSSYSRLTARVAWRRALQRQGVAAVLRRSLLILNVYAGVRQMSRKAADKTQPCERAGSSHLITKVSLLRKCRFSHPIRGVVTRHSRPLTNPRSRHSLEKLGRSPHPARLTV